MLRWAVLLLLLTSLLKIFHIGEGLRKLFKNALEVKYLLHLLPLHVVHPSLGGGHPCGIREVAEGVTLQRLLPFPFAEKIPSSDDGYKPLPMMILGERDFPIFEQNKSGKGLPLPTDDFVNDVTPLPKRV